MRFTPFIFFVVLAIVGFSKMANYDQVKYDRALLVIRGYRIGEDSAVDKYKWETVRVINILKNLTTDSIGSEIIIAVYNDGGNIPEKECTIYLTRYNVEKNAFWKLLEGRTETGISNIKG